MHVQTSIHEISVTINKPVFPKENDGVIVIVFWGLQEDLHDQMGFVVQNDSLEPFQREMDLSFSFGNTDVIHTMYSFIRQIIWHNHLEPALNC